MKLSVETVKKIAEEIDMLPDEAAAYLNRNTGEVYMMLDDFLLDEDDLENPNAAAAIPDWQKEDFAKRRDVLNDGAWVLLPNAFDIHEWKLMERFSDQIKNQEVKEDLLRSIHQSGAFRLFKRELDHYNLCDEWYAFKKACIVELVEDWLRLQNIEFEEET